MKKYFLKILPVIILLIWQGNAQAQTINTTAGSVTSCPDEILVPINVTNFNSVGAVSLVLNFNSTVLSFLGYQNLHASMASGQLVVNASGNSAYIIWVSSSGATIGTGTMMNLRFDAVPGTSMLNWDTQTPGNCEYTHTNGTTIPATFVNGTATIQQPPVITSQPENKSVLVGQSTSFSVGANGTGLSYKWYLSTNGGTTWTLINSGGYYSGATSPTLSISNIPLTFNGYLYRSEITGTCSPVAVTNHALLSVTKPLITSFEAPNVCPGSILIPVLTSNFTDVASFSLSFSYPPDVLAFTGYQNLNPLIPAGNFVCNAIGGMVYMTWATTTPVTFTTDTTLVKVKFDAVTGSANLNWNTNLTGHCEYTRLSGERITAVFQNNSFTVFQPPVISTHPTDKLIPELTNTSFSVTAQASGIGYQWQISTNNGNTFTNLTNGGFYSGVNAATLGISGATLVLNGNLYRCVISGTCSPSVNSDAAKLTVLPKITTTAATISGCPGNSLVVPINVERFIDVASFSLTLNFNPSILTFAGYQSLNTNLNDANVIINAANNSVLMTGYSTSPVTIGTGLLVELLFTGTPGSSALTWNTLLAGACEYVTIDGTTIFTNFVNGSVTVHQPPVLNTQPVNKTTYIGGSTTFSVGATGTSIGYQWQVSTNSGGTWINLMNGAPYSGVLTANLTVNPASANLNGNWYRCYIAGTCSPFVYSDPGILTVTQLPVYTIAGSVSNSCTGNVNVPVQVTNCNNIGGISLVLLYDPTKLTYTGYHSLHAELLNGILIVNQSENKVILSWASLDAAEIGSGTLIQYKFIANSGISTTLSWDTQTSGNCEYSDINGNIVTAFFTNGTVNTIANSLVVNAGADVTIPPGGSTQLNGTVTGGAAPFTYAWSPTAGLSNPNILNPIASPASTTTYRLTVTGNNGCSGWDEVKVTVEVFCPAPTELAVSNTTATSASLNWIAGGVENQWDILWGESGFDPSNSGTLNSGITNRPYTLVNLQPGMIYDCYVRASCGGGFFSSWTGPQNFTTLNLHTLIIPQGWSGLSSFLIPQNSSVVSIFQPIIADLIILESQTAMYWPEENINTIGNWNTHEGYTIKLSNPVQLDFVGSLENDKTLQLSAGWNLIPVLSQCDVDVMALFSGKDLIIVKEVAGWKLFWPSMNVNTLEVMQPGKAYFVKMGSATEITFPGCGKPEK
ncbi:MAG: fibronectin type III domain-containing protein [Bacteroidales bacterium]|nr:fibronectin type III domain-containing protein [Bacteroidales bacterium]